MATTTTLRITLPLTLAQLSELTDIVSGRGSAKLSLTTLENLLDAIKSGVFPGVSSIEWQIGGTEKVHASGTFTFSGIATATKVYVINGVTFTARTSGATGNEFNKGASLSVSANALAVAINASATAGIAKTVFATALGIAATATAACASVIATNTLRVGKVLFTMAATGGDPTDVSQVVAVGGTDTAMGDNLCAAINAHPSLKGTVVASNSSGTITITASARGTEGNKILLDSTGATITCSSAALAGGLNDVLPNTGTVGAVAATGVCTVYARAPGPLGNLITTTTDDSNCTAGASTLASGAGDDVLPNAITMS
jgi:hypothetical protein